MSKSGGIITYNLREGFRSEYLADYVFSAFGPSLQVAREDDYGIDMICNMAYQDGKLMRVEATYGVQIKSQDTAFKYLGKQAVDWLFSLEFPLFFAEVSKEASTVKIFSSWNINRFLLGLEKGKKDSYPAEITFVPDENDELTEPNVQTGLIPIGKPILDFNIMDLGDKDKRERFKKILNEWLEFEVKNYSLRRAGISCTFGYIKWETNKSLDEGFRVWYRPYFYSPLHNENAKKLFTEAAIVVGLYLKNSFAGNQNTNFQAEFNQLQSYINLYCKEYLDEWGQNVFKESI